MARGESKALIDHVGALARSLRSIAAQEYAKFEVGSTQAKFLRHIGRHARISQADLARATSTDPALTGRTVEVLVERGWVRRAKSEDDRRQYVLELAPPGERVRRRVEDARARIAEQVAAVLDEKDQKDLERIARKIVDAFGDPDR